MKANYVHKDTLTASDYVELNKNNELLINYNQSLLKENQELKKKYENAVADYETAMAEKEQLKKQLEDKEDYINKLQATKDKLDKWDYENAMQQKEFINFLEDNYKETQDIWYIKILQKYKSIIGVKDENN